MTTTNNYLNQAELALASYSTLTPGIPRVDALIDQGRGMSTIQAQKFADSVTGYTVITQYNHPTNGLSATIFADASGKKYLAIRGTEPQLNDLTADGLLAVGLPAWLNPQFIALKAQIDSWRNAPQFLGNQPFTVTGHSLGGYLAAAVKQQYGAQVSDAYIYNAPGVSGLVGNILSVFGLSGTISANMWNIRADASISPIAGLGAQVAPVIRVAIEDQTVGVPSPPAALNHSQQVLTDALSLLDTFTKLDASLSVPDFNALIESTSGQNHLTLESALDALRKLVLGVDGGATEAGNRDAFYTNVYALQDSAAYKNLAASGSAKITALGTFAAAQIEGLAASSSSAGLAARYVLQALNPFALVGIDYASLNVNGALNLYNTDTAPSGMTPEYLADRSSFLARKLWFSTQDKNPVDPAVVAGPDHSQYESDATYFKDYASGYQIAQGFAPDSPMNSIHRYLFGDGNANTLTGGGVEDSLYGGAGNETLNGLGGADYLEGNAGADSLNGGDGGDLLLGGVGADTLDGGTGVSNDVLNGGADADLYVVGKDAGVDTLASSDAADRLKLGTRTLDGNGTFVSSSNGVTVWRDSSVSTDPITYSLDTAAKTLTIKGAHSTVLVKDFVSGDLGIGVPIAPAPPPPPATTFEKDLSSSTQPSLFWPAASIEADAAQANHLFNFNNWYVGSYANMVLINAKGNNDWIEGGAGTNTNLKLVKAGSGDDQIYASTTQTLADAVAAQEVAVATGRSDLLLDGGFGDDSVFGAAGDDALFGGEGTDTIVGGAGTDVIFSDGDPGLQYSELNQQSTAGFRWVEGSNAGGSSIYFNGTPRFGSVAYGYVGVTPSSVDGHFTGNYYSTESTDFTPLASLGQVPLAAADYRPGWTARADGQFYATYPPTGTFDPQAGYYFNTNRYNGNDVVFSGSGDDMVNAGGGDDYVNAGSDGDIVRGFQGDDLIYGGTGNDNLLGDSYASLDLEDDRFLGVSYRKYELDPSVAGQEHGNDFIDGGADNDRIEGNGGADVLFGGSGSDSMFGDDSATSSDEFILELYAGNDFIDTGDGDDFAEGGARDDSILGGQGADALFGDNHFVDNVAAAGRVTATGDDSIDGGIGNDSIWGEGGNDLLTGGTGNDQILGDGKATDLRAELHGFDDIDGGAGNDTILGGGGNDVLRGDEDNDWLAGENQLSTDETTTLIGDDILLGGAGSDTLLGGVGADKLDGGTGNDTMVGGDGADTYVFGIGSGNDVIINRDGDALGSKSDTLLLQAGITTENIVLQSTDLFSSSGSLVIRIAGSVDTLRVSDYLSSNSTSSNAVEFFEFSDGTVWNISTVKSKTSGQSSAGVSLTGTESNNSLSGGEKSDWLYGRGGSDLMRGAGGDDYLEGGTGADSLFGDLGNDVYAFNLGDGADTILDAGGNDDVLRFSPSILASDISVTRSGNDLVLRHTNGTDYIRLQGWLQYSAGSHQVEKIKFSDVTWTADQITSRVLGLTGTDGDDWIESQSGYAEPLLGLAGNDTLRAWGAGDTLDGGTGDDLLEAASSSSERRRATFIGGKGNDTLNGSYEGDVYAFNLGDGADVIHESDAGQLNSDELRFGPGIASIDIAASRSGDDLLLKHTNGTDRITITGWFSAGAIHQIEQIKFNDVTWTAEQVTGTLLTITGTTGDDNLLGGDTYAETLRGLAGNDTLSAAGQGDTLDGGEGNDVLNTGYGTSKEITFVGGKGSDVIQSSATADKFIFNLGDGADTISDYGDLIDQNGLVSNDQLSFDPGISSAAITPSRSGLDLILKHSNGTDRVTVKDWFSDVYHQIEQIEFGDTTWTSSQVTARVLDRQGTTGADSLTGALAYMPETLRGLAGNDTLTAYGADILDGGEGDDLLKGGTDVNTWDGSQATFVGGRGNDTIVGSYNSETLVFFLGDGRDTVSADSSWSIYDELHFGPGISSDDLTFYRVGTDLLVKHADGTDQIRVESWFSYDSGRSAYLHQLNKIKFNDNTILTADQVNALVVALPTPSEINGTTGADSITGSTGDDVINGLAGNDTLDGAAGADTLLGGAGDDVYVIDNVADSVTELADEGRDTVRASLTWTLSTNTEDLILTGAADVNGTGNTLANTLIGNAGSNRLDGTAGVDTMTGGPGDDIYLVDNAGDVTIEVASGGADAVEATLSWTLAAEVEKLTLTGTAANNATGNALANILIGNAGVNQLDGAAGADVMTGGAGNDTYVVDNLADTTVELAAGGTDAVQSALSWTLANEVEKLTLTGSAANNANGNALANTLIGNSGANRLDGGSGADSMTGGAGSDTYVVDNTGDTTVELASGGTDTVMSSITWTLASEVESLTLTGTATINATGNALINTLIGNAAANRLNGAAGADSMTGGAGNDIYVVDNAGDKTIELAAGGTDAVESSISWTLASEVEKLTLTGTAAVNATGNTLANMLIGNAGINRLSGAAGADAMTGGGGNDTYVVDNAGDTTIELAAGGTDVVESSIGWTLASEVEKLTLTGTANISGTGNNLANTLTGNTGANALNGGAGNDSLSGGAGNDTYTGGTGSDTLSDTSTTSNDIYRWGRGEGADILADAGGTDRLDVLTGATEGQIWLRRLGNNLELSVIGTSDSLTINGWYATTANRVESFKLADGQALLASQVQQLVDAMAAFAPPSAGQTTLPANYQTALNPVIAPSWA